MFTFGFRLRRSLSLRLVLRLGLRLGLKLEGGESAQL